MLAGLLLTMGAGCGKELTDSDIKGTKLYKDLETDYSQLERKYNKLVDSRKKEDSSSEEEASYDADVYLKNVRGSTYVRIQYMEIATSKSESSDNISMCKWLKTILGKAIVNTNINITELQAEQTALYSYALYNENNSLVTCSIYDGDLVVFNDIPDYVYYVPEVTRIGAGCFGNGKDYKAPRRTVYSELYESQLAFKDGDFLEREQIRKAASALAASAPKHLGMKPAYVENTAISEYIFKCDGNTYMMEVYSNCFSITKNGNEVEWYSLSKEAVKNYLKADSNE